MTNTKINEIFNITESFQLPEKLMSIMLDDELRTRLFEKFSDEDLSCDIFNNYFQEQHSNRANMMQDFTPNELAEVVSSMLGEYKTCLDVCAGTGGLTIAAWKNKPNALYYTEELSFRAFPILLFNMAIRNMQGFAINKDVLSKEFKRGFKLIKGERYSEIKEIEAEPLIDEYDVVIMNPPYSMRHEWNTKEFDQRFEGYAYPPTKASDYAFVLDGLYYLSNKGRLVSILPHGILFRGGSEKIIRTNLINNNTINAIVGLPEKLFMNTAIPVCLLILERDCNNIFFIDASREFEKSGKINLLKKKNVKKIIDTFIKRIEYENYSKKVTLEEVRRNDFNLNISRYVSTYVPPPPIDLDATLNELSRLDDEIQKTQELLSKQLIQLNGKEEKDEQLIKKTAKVLNHRKGDKLNGQISIFDLNIDC